MSEKYDFEQLGWGDFNLVGEITLPSWQDFKCLEGSSSFALSPGTYCLEVIPTDEDSMDEDMEDQASPAQQDAVNYLIAHESAVHTSVLCAVFEQYSEMQNEYGKDLVPDGDLEQLIELSTVYVHPVAKDGIAYIGFLFHCLWDDEHGLGVMTHKERVVDTGGADTAFLEWIAEKDAESSH